MGRIFETRKHTMFARYDRMAKAFTRCGREIAIAVRNGGADPSSNPQLRRALQNARSANMPKDKVQKAIDRALGKDKENWEEVLYEGYGPHGVPMVIVTVTNNPTRTVANVRVIFKKAGGNLGTSGSVGFLFTRMAVFRLNPEGVDAEELELELIDYGLEELGEGEDDNGNPVLIARCTFEEFGTMQNHLETTDVDVKSSGIEYIPNAATELSNEHAEEVLKLVAKLEEDDDVQTVFHSLS